MSQKLLTYRTKEMSNLNSIVSGVHLKVTHTYTDLQHFVTRGIKGLNIKVTHFL